MKLQKYLSRNKITTQEFADMIRVSVGAVRKWRTGERIPRPRIMTKIRQATKGKVGPNDWFE